MSAISARTLSRYILLPLAMVFVVVVIIVATVKGIELLVMNQWEAAIIAKSERELGGRTWQKK